MDDLDEELVVRISKKSNFPSNDVAPKFNSQPNIDFDEDDPLADLLSDEDLQTDGKQSRVQIKGSLVSDLFGMKSTDLFKADTIRAKSQPQSSSAKDISTDKADQLPDKSKDELRLASMWTDKVLAEPQETRDSKQADNIVDNLEIGPSSADKAKKSSLMKDLFGGGPKSNTLRDSLILADPVSIAESKMIEVQKKSEQLAQSNSSGYAPTVSAPRESRRGRRTSGGIVDPLGMFSVANLMAQVVKPQDSEQANSSKFDQFPSSEQRDVSTTFDEATENSVSRTGNLPEWLGGPRKSNAGVKLQATGCLLPDTPLKAPHRGANNSEATEKETGDPERPVDRSERLALLTGTQFDQEATVRSLQQQGRELKTVATLASQSDHLNKIIESQRIRLNDQEKQLDVLIKRQIEKQQSLEMQMKAQQERINSHLQVLLAQPASVASASTNIDAKYLSNGTGEDNVNSTEFGNIFQIFEAEKVCFENIFCRLKDRHVKEIAIIEESYTRQIETMGLGMERLEKRLRQDAGLAEADCEAKVQKWKAELESQKIAHGEEVENLKKRYGKRIEEIYDQQRHDIELMRNKYTETIENICKAKDIERQTVDDAATQTKSLSETLGMMKTTVNDMRELKVRLENNNKDSYRDREMILKQQIEELKDLTEHLKQQHEAMEADRKQLAEATRRLESGTLRLNFEFDRHVKENTETETRLKSREEALVREKELLDAQIQWERNHIQAMKDTWIREQERQAKQLSEERNSLAAERARLQTLQRLKSNDNDTAKSELEAALDAARHASDLANSEKRKWQEKLTELDVEKRRIREKENSLTLQARELEDLTQSALATRKEGLRALKEARYLEEQHEAYLRELQIRSEALAQRENEVAAEQLGLSRVRLTSRMFGTDKPEKDTGKSNSPVGHIGEQSFPHRSQMDKDLPDSQISTTHFKEIIDPRLIILKLDLDNELDLTNACLDTIQSVVQ